MSSLTPMASGGCWPPQKSRSCGAGFALAAGRTDRVVVGELLDTGQEFQDAGEGQAGGGVAAPDGPFQARGRRGGQAQDDLHPASVRLSGRRAPHGNSVGLAGSSPGRAAIAARSPAPGQGSRAGHPAGPVVIPP